MAQQLIQNVIDILDSAHSQQLLLSESLSSVQEAKSQINYSADQSKEKVQKHFKWLEERIKEKINERLEELLAEVDHVKESALSPLNECEEMISSGITAAAKVMEEDMSIMVQIETLDKVAGKKILGNNPDEHIEDLVKFKDNPDTKRLHSVPEIPCLPDVPYLSVDCLHEDLESKITELFKMEGKVLERGPAQISNIEERPGSLLISWVEIDDEAEALEFCLQYCFGKAKSNEDANITFHTAYTGPNTSSTVRHLRCDAPYSFRVRSRADSQSPWSVWSVPRVASTSIPHYKWCNTTESYSTSNEDKTASRMDVGDTRVLYSDTNSYTCGFPITFRVLEAGEKTPFDGIGLSADCDEIDTMQRSDSIFVATSGSVYVDGQEMKTRLPELTRGSKVTMETEDLTNGKIRVSVEVEGKEVTFDWKVKPAQSISSLMGAFGTPGKPSPINLYFGMRFSHEDWRIGVE